MNRDELAHVIWQALRDSGSVSMFSIGQAADEVRDALWPVLAQVWAEGHCTGDDAPNPYGDTASSAT